MSLLDGDNGPGHDDLVVAPLLEEPAVEGEVFSLIGKSDVVDPKETAVEEQAGVALHDEVVLKNLLILIFWYSHRLFFHVLAQRMNYKSFSNTIEIFFSGDLYWVYNFILQHKTTNLPDQSSYLVTLLTA